MNRTDTVDIRHATLDPAEAESLADVLIDSVEGGATVGYMLPLPREKAVAFWRACQAGMARGERILLVAEDASTRAVVGTVQVNFSSAENQPHRADVAKLLVHRSMRRRGLGASLMSAAEDAARAAGKTLLGLYTVTGSEAERLYSKLGWTRVGEIPDYSFGPRGGMRNFTVFYKKLG